jgi:hypothetical protein
MLSFLLPDSPETPALLLASTSQVCTFSLTSHPIFRCQIRGEKSPLLLLPLCLEKEEKELQENLEVCREVHTNSVIPQNRWENCEIGAGIPWWNAIRIIPDVSGTQSRSCA